MPTCYRFIVKGHVQGVGFRQATLRQAQRLSLVGWVRNREDGSVEGRVSGTDAATLIEFHRWLAKGPPACTVTAVEWAGLTCTDHADSAADAGFVIRR